MIRALIVVEFKFYYEGLTEVLDRNQLFAVVGATNCREEALRRVRDCEIDVVLLDMAMPGSLDILGEILKVEPGLNVIALGVSEVETEIIACAEAGVSGYVARNASLDDLVMVVKCAVRGELSCSPRIARVLMRRVNSLAASHAPAEEPGRLTARELEIAKLIGQGLANKEIARELRIGVSTVKNHVHNILEKLQVGRRGEVAGALRAQRQVGVGRAGLNNHALPPSRLEGI